jgi:hypothetical protein
MRRSIPARLRPCETATSCHQKVCRVPKATAKVTRHTNHWHSGRLDGCRARFLPFDFPGQGPSLEWGHLRRFLQWSCASESLDSLRLSHRQTRERPTRGPRQSLFVGKACPKLRESAQSSWSCKTGCQYVTVWAREKRSTSCQTAIQLAWHIVSASQLAACEDI